LNQIDLIHHGRACASAIAAHRCDRIELGQRSERGSDADSDHPNGDHGLYEREATRAKGTQPPMTFIENHENLKAPNVPLTVLSL
jgi:hypothetical protein